MQQNSEIAGRAYVVPGHVPPELVKPFDLFGDPDMSVDPFAAIEKLRPNGRIFWNPTNPDYGGSWVLTHAEDLRFVLTNNQNFVSKNKLGVFKEENALELIPLELDGGRHTKFRALLNPFLSPPAIAKMAAGVLETAVEMIEAIRHIGGCHFMAEFGNPFPVSVFMQLMGLPKDDMKRFLDWEAGILHTGDNVSRQTSAEAVCHYLTDLAARRRENPVGDMVSFIVSAKIDGKVLTDNEVLGLLYLLFLAGLDTVGSTMSFLFYHLATHHDQQQQLRENPSLIPAAVEELLRRYSIVVPHRQCTQDVEIAGVQIKAGDWITIITGLGSTDPTEFERPLEVNFKRSNPRHLAFAFGPHFCIGLHLARRELEVALQEWLARIPMWRLKAGAPVKAHGGFSFGYEDLELEW